MPLFSGSLWSPQISYSSAEFEQARGSGVLRIGWLGFDGVDWLWQPLFVIYCSFIFILVFLITMGELATLVWHNIDWYWSVISVWWEVTWEPIEYRFRYITYCPLARRFKWDFVFYISDFQAKFSDYYVNIGSGNGATKQCWLRSMSPYSITRPQWVKCTLFYGPCVYQWFDWVIKTEIRDWWILTTFQLWAHEIVP